MEWVIAILYKIFLRSCSLQISHSILLFRIIHRQVLLIKIKYNRNYSKKIYEIKLSYDRSFKYCVNDSNLGPDARNKYCNVK